MKKRQILVAAGLLFFAASCSTQTEQTAVDYSQYVDTSIGTGGHGHVFVGANVPFGFVQLGPTSITEGWDWVSGYHESESTVIGFSHTHLSGTGIGDLLDVTVMPVVGEVTYARGNEKDQNSGAWSYADRSKEVSVPGYYSVPLTRYNVLAELTSTERVGFHRYTFPASTEAALVFDLENGGNWDDPTQTYMKQVSPTAIEGYRYSKGWADKQRIYFYAEFSKPFDKFEVVDEKSRYARMSFQTEEGEQVMLRVALSPTSIEGAKKNMAAELTNWDFETVAQNADKKWDDQLSKIHISTTDESARKVFYTALYHTMIAPSLFCDVDGTYAGSDNKNHAYDGFQNYTTFSLWDTYRAAQPLMTIIHPEMMPDIINTMIHIYEQQGKLPVWHLMGNETNCMVGNPGVAVVADAIVKGLSGFDKEEAFEAVKNSAMVMDRGQNFRVEYGYIPSDKFLESVAYDMEYAIADGAAAQAAKTLGKTADYEYFDNRSHSYRRFFDSETEFMRGVTSKGDFREPFSPFHSTHRDDDYCEGNAWQYTWLAPHDLDGLVDCFGTEEAFVQKLDSLFLVSSVLEGDASPDISGLIGQYAHGNEPSHHILYLYTMIGQPWKAAEKVREVLTTLYTDQPDGLSGNEDVGQMSAWYILSSMGMYQVEPASTDFYFGSPLFDSVDIAVPAGKFSIVAHNNSKENIYIQSVKLNGEEYAKPYISYHDIMKGGKLEFTMGTEKGIWYEDPKFGK